MAAFWREACDGAGYRFASSFLEVQPGGIWLDRRGAECPETRFSAGGSEKGDRRHESRWRGECAGAADGRGNALAAGIGREERFHPRRGGLGAADFAECREGPGTICRAEKIEGRAACASG